MYGLYYFPSQEVFPDPLTFIGHTQSIYICLLSTFYAAASELGPVEI